jgi:hypothetical protein
MRVFQLLSNTLEYLGSIRFITTIHFLCRQLNYLPLPTLNFSFKRFLTLLAFLLDSKNGFLFIKNYLFVVNLLQWHNKTPSITGDNLKTRCSTIDIDNNKMFYRRNSNYDGTRREILQKGRAQYN